MFFFFFFILAQDFAALPLPTGEGGGMIEGPTGAVRALFSFLFLRIIANLHLLNFLFSSCYSSSKEMDRTCLLFFSSFALPALSLWQSASLTQEIHASSRVVSPLGTTLCLFTASRQTVISESAAGEETLGSRIESKQQGIVVGVHSGPS